MTRDQRVAVGLALFSVIYLVAAWNLPRFGLATGSIDSYVFPMALGAVLFGLSVVLYLQGAGKKPSGRLLEGTDLPLLLKFMGAVAAYAVIMAPLGFVVATTLFLAAGMLLLGVRKWSLLGIIAVGFAFGVYSLFVFVLKVPLARGIMPF